MTRPTTPALSACLAGLLVVGCSLTRAPILGERSRDAGLDTAADPDSPISVDDASFDATELDAPDAAVPDVGVCVPAVESCNAIDDDCNGLVDDGACVACTTFEHAGHVYQRCPVTYGWDAWSGACRRLGPRYDLPIIDDAAEDAALRAMTADTSFIGLNDFESNAAWRWVDHTTASGGYVGRWSVGEGARPNEGCFILRSDGSWDDVSCAAYATLLCEGDPGRRGCAAIAPDDATCDGVDDDCDGRPDEDATCGRLCVVRPFWDTTYARCPLGETATGSSAFCASSTPGRLAVVQNATVLTWLGLLLDADGWIGLTQAAGSPDGTGWSRADGTSFPMTDEWWGTLWAPGEPSGGLGEDCGALANGTDRLGDGACGTTRPYAVCERPWAR